MQNLTTSTCMVLLPFYAVTINTRIIFNQAFWLFAAISSFAKFIESIVKRPFITVNELHNCTAGTKALLLQSQVPHTHQIYNDMQMLLRSPALGTL